jgi:hypothetical protein
MTDIHDIPTPMVQPIPQVLEPYALDPRVRALLQADLVDRDNRIADALRLAAARHGAMTQLTAEVICQIGIGDQPDEATRQHIHEQYHLAWAEVQRFLAEGGGGPTV